MTQLIYPLVALLFELSLPKALPSADSVPTLPAKNSAHSPVPFYKLSMVSLLLEPVLLPSGNIWKGKIDVAVVSDSATNELCDLGRNTGFSFPISKMGTVNHIS